MLEVGYHFQDDSYGGPEMGAATFLDVGGWGSAQHARQTMCRPYFKGKPEPQYVAERALLWHGRGARVVVANEPNLKEEDFPGGPEDYAAYFLEVQRRAPGVRLYYAGMAPADALNTPLVKGNWRDWYTHPSARQAIVVAAGIVVHAYGPPTQIVDTLLFFDREFPGKPLWLSEFNPGAGNRFDLDAYAQQLPELLTALAQFRQLEAATWFSWKWDYSPKLPSSVDAAGTAVERILRDWTPPKESAPEAPAPAPSPAPAEEAPTGGQVIRGCDVSNWQRTPDFERVKAAGYDFVVIKVAEDDFGDDDFYDPYAEVNWANAERAGLVRGVYTFVRPSKSSPAESVTLLEKAIVKIGGLKPGDFYVLDVEDEKYQGSLHQWLAEALDLAERVLGFPGWKYSGRWYTQTRDLEHPDLERWPTWWAAYQDAVPAPVPGWTPIRMWQNSAHARVDGIPGDADTNVFFGTVDDLRATGMPAPVAAPVVVPPAPPVISVDEADIDDLLVALEQAKLRALAIKNRRAA